MLLSAQVHPQDSPELRLLRPKVLTAAKSLHTCSYPRDICFSTYACTASVQVNPQDSPELRLVRPKVLTAAGSWVTPGHVVSLNSVLVLLDAGEPTRLSRAASVAAQGAHSSKVLQPTCTPPQIGSACTTVLLLLRR
jgi:hypothetical protein